MSEFSDLQQAYTVNPASVLERVDALEPQTRLDLLLAHLGERIRAKQVPEDEKASPLPEAYRRVKTRWPYFDYLLGEFDDSTLKRHMEPHLEFETEGGTYIRNTLALLVWKSVQEQTDEGGGR